MLFRSGISGAKGRDQRPAFDRLCRAATRREVDVVMAWSVAAGSLATGPGGLPGRPAGSDVDLYLHQQGVDTTTPGGKALFQMMGVFAEFERAMMRDRIKAGLARARAQGKRLGRPPVSPEVEQAIRDARAEGKGMLKIGRELGVGTATVQRVLRS